MIIVWTYGTARPNHSYIEEGEENNWISETSEAPPVVETPAEPRRTAIPVRHLKHYKYHDERGKPKSGKNWPWRY